MAQDRVALRIAGCAPRSVAYLALLSFLLLAGGGPSQAQEARPQPRFAVLEFRVVGNSVLPPTVIEEAVYPHLGPGRTAEDIERARAALEEAYTRAGYATVSVDLPRQSVDDGVVTLRVVERPVGRLRVAGAEYTLPSAVRRQAPSLAEGQVPNLAAVQRDIAALNRSPDRRVTPELRAGSAPDTVDVDLRVEDRLPLRANLELNNRRSANTSALRTSGNIRYDNAWQRGDSINLGFQTAPERTRDSLVLSGSYLWRLPGDPAGPALLASFVRSDSDTATVGGSSVIGRGTIIGLRGLLPLGGEAGFTHSALFGIDRKHFEEGILLGADRTDVPITYYPLSAGWQGAWSGEQTTTQLGATLTMGVRGWGSDTAEFERKRAFASAGWSHLRLDGSHMRRLDNDIQLSGQGQAQAARDPLISNEQFGGGGVDSVRGYLESETLGDVGGSGQLEVRSPSFAQRIGPRVNDWRAHAFLDGGNFALHRPLPQQRSSATLLSAGIGTRVQMLGGLQGSLETAAALRDGPLSPAGTLRTLFRIRGEF
jgi:hemolysin activation/secretion protein